MPFLTTTKRSRPARTTAHTAHTARTKPSLLSRLTGQRGYSERRRTRRPATTTTVPVHHHKRRTSIGDKVSGALLRLKGALTGRSGEKAAGTRRMRGTDGRGSRKRARY